MSCTQETLWANSAVWDTHHPLQRLWELAGCAISGFLPFSSCKSRAILKWIRPSELHVVHILSTRGDCKMGTWRDGVADRQIAVHLDFAYSAVYYSLLYFHFSIEIRKPLPYFIINCQVDWCPGGCPTFSHCCNFKFWRLNCSIFLVCIQVNWSPKMGEIAKRAVTFKVKQCSDQLTTYSLTYILTCIHTV